MRSGAADYYSWSMWELTKKIDCSDDGQWTKDINSSKWISDVQQPFWMCMFFSRLLFLFFFTIETLIVSSFPEKGEKSQRMRGKSSAHDFVSSMNSYLISEME
jgi:hypothetical protein